MKFTGSIIGKILSAILCILLGVVLTLGGIVGGGYLLLTTTTMGKVEQYAGEYVPDIPINFNETIENKTVLEWGTELIGLASNLETATIGDLEGIIGYPAISDALYEIIGVDVQTVQSSTFGNLGDTISNSMTLNAISDKMGINLPDMPLFKDTEFLNKPISTAFEGLTDYPLSSFVEMNEEETNAVLLAIKNLTISELGGEKLTQAVNGVKISDVITIDENSNNVLQALKDLTIGELGGTKADGIINSLFLGEILDIDDTSTQVLQALKYSSLESAKATLTVTEADASTAAFVAGEDYDAEKELAQYDYLYTADGKAYVCIKDENGIAVKVTVDDVEKYSVYETKLFEGKYHPIEGINDKIDTLSLSQIMDIDESNTLLWSLRNSTLKSLGDDINRLFLAEIMTINADSSKTLQALKYTGLETSTTNIPVSSVVAHSESALEESGYCYYYTQNEVTGEYTAYIAIIDDTTGMPTTATVAGVSSYMVYQTKLFDGKYRPIISIDEKMQELYIGEIMTIEDDSSKILQALKYSTLESKKCSLSKTAFDASTTTYIASENYDASLEESGFSYLYSESGVAYIKQMDNDGNPVTTVSGADIFYSVYKTRLFDGKLRPMRGVDDRIKVMTLGEVIKIDATSSRLLRSLENTKIDEMNTAIEKLFMDEIITIDENSTEIIKAIRFSTLESVYKYIPTEAIVAVYADATKCLPDYSYVKYDDEVYVRIYSEGTQVTENIDGVMNYKYYVTKLYGANGGVEEKYYPLKGLNDTLDTLTISDVFSVDELNTGILGLISPDTKLDDISNAVATAVQNSSLGILIGVGVIDDSTFNFDGLPKPQRAFIVNSTMTEVIAGMINFIGEPLAYNDLGIPTGPNYGLVSPTEIELSGTFNSITDFVADYEMYNTINLSDNLIVNVSAADDEQYAVRDTEGTLLYYAVPLFNLTGASYTLTFNGGTVKLGIYDGESLGGYQYGYSYDMSAGSGLTYVADTITSYQGH